MRAIFYPYDQIETGEVLTITGDNAHHLNVVRLKKNEEILILNGKGKKLYGEILTISKNLVSIQVKKSEQDSDLNHNISLIISVPKKEAFEDILKISVELGIRNIHPVKTSFSQYEYEPSERIQKILESALIQSNNLFIPTIHPQVSLKGLLAFKKEQIVFFNSQVALKKKSLNLDENLSILIGPEGGFSLEEIEEILTYPNLIEVKLPTPILRAPTAVASSVGYLLAAKSL